MATNGVVSIAEGVGGHGYRRGAMYASDFFDCLDLCVAEIVALARMSS